MIFVKKALDKITRLHQNCLPNQGSSPDSESEQEESNVEKSDWNAKICLLLVAQLIAKER